MDDARDAERQRLETGAQRAQLARTPSTTRTIRVVQPIKTKPGWADAQVSMLADAEARTARLMRLDAEQRAQLRARRRRILGTIVALTTVLALLGAGGVVAADYLGYAHLGIIDAQSPLVDADATTVQSRAADAGQSSDRSVDPGRPDHAAMALPATIDATTRVRISHLENGLGTMHRELVDVDREIAAKRAALAHGQSTGWVQADYANARQRLGELDDKRASLVARIAKTEQERNGLLGSSTR